MKIRTYNYLTNNEVIYSQEETTKTSDVLLPGVYTLSYERTFNGNRIIIKLNNFNDINENNIKFKEKECVDSLFNSFFDDNVRNKIHSFGELHKSGIIFYGPEGTGKSTIVKNYICDFIKNRDCLAFYISFSNSDDFKEIWNFIKDVRLSQKNTIIIIFEEFDDIATSNESELKSILDGNLSIDDCIFFATTNHIDNIPKTIKDRPSRFKYVINIDKIDDVDEIYDIVNSLIGDLPSYSDKNEVKKLAKELKNNSLDVIKQKCFDIIMDLKSYNNSKSKNKIGF